VAPVKFGEPEAATGGGGQQLQQVGDAGTRFEGLEEDGAHREWLSTAVQLDIRGTAAGAWTVGHRHRLGGRRAA
jgi:hypothetical protein